MFLGADKFRHQEYGAIKKCSKCHDKNLRYLTQLSAGGKQPVFLCGNGHIVFPEYDDQSPGTPYVLLEGNPLYDLPFEIEQGSHGTKNCGCCDGGAAYGCNLPNQIEVKFNNFLGVAAGATPIQAGINIYEYPNWGRFKNRYNVCDHNNITGGETPASSWSAQCDCISMAGPCVICPYEGQPNMPSAGDFSWSDNCNVSNNVVFWVPTDNNNPYDRCGNTYPDLSLCNNCDPNNMGGPECFEGVVRPYCHDCGTHKCSDFDAKYRFPCSPPDNNFSYSLSDTSTKVDPQTVLSAFISAGLALVDNVSTVGYGVGGACLGGGNNPTNAGIAAYAAGPYLVGLLPGIDSPDIGNSYGNIEAYYEELFDSFWSRSFLQPHCARKVTGSEDINVEDINNQRIILDRVDYNSSIFWDDSDRRSKEGVEYQAYIETPIIGQSGSDVEPELIALIISESGTGGQIAFQTYPVTFDTDNFIEDDTPPETKGNACKTKTRIKAFGYGVMYPFIDDPIWRTENSNLEGEDIGGGPAYNFPVFLPGKNYKVGDKIEFRFWQTLDNPPQPDPSAGEVYRTVVLATATITEVDGTGGILWYEFDGEPISGDCPCTKDKYCGWLSRACYPEEHPNTEDGIEGYCPRGEMCEGLVVEDCLLSLPVYTGSNCFPLSPSWDIGGYHGRSSCSGLAEDGIPATWDGQYIIPSKAPRYYYAWLPDPDCFFAYDNDFLEYMAFDEYFSFNGPFFNQDRDDFPGCSPLYKIYRNATTDNLDIKTRFKDYYVVGPPCRKTYIASDANTLFVKYDGGDGSIVNPPSTARTDDNYCRVYGFYQQKQYNCGVTYEGQYILRAQTTIGSCQPIIETIRIEFNRAEVKNDITISAPVHQDYLLPEFLPTPENGVVSAAWPYQQGKLNNWILYDPFSHIPDPRGNCAISAKVYYEQNGKIEYDCDNFWTTEDNGATWDANDYKEYYDGFNKRTAWRNTFEPICGYPWEYNCKKGGTNSDFVDPTPSCFIDENGEVVCEGIDETGNFTDPEQDPCNPYCMLSNSSANIVIKDIETDPGCLNGDLITANNRYFIMRCSPFQANYTSIIEIPGLERTDGCNERTSHIPGNNDFVVIFAFGDKSIVTPQIVDAKIQEYLLFWEQRYADLGLGWPGVAAILGNNEGQPFDRGLTNFYNTIFEIEGLGRVHVLPRLCEMADYFPPSNDINDCPFLSEWLDRMYNEGRNAVHEFGGKIKEIGIINPGDGYAFEVEERYPPSGVVQPKDIVLEINSISSSKRRKLETWSLDNYTLTHNGNGYSVGDTIPISFNDQDAIRGGVQYKSIPTIEVTEVDESGIITNSSILNSGEYYKWIKTGQHRAYPVSIIVNNYWESPKEGIIGIGRHAELRPVVGVDPTQDTYGKIIDIIIDESGIEYLPTGKYWFIDTYVGKLNIQHLVDPCRHEIGVGNPLSIQELLTVGNVSNTVYINSPSDNNGVPIKWKDKVKPWSTIITSGECPLELMNKTYEMCLLENVQLMPADCSSSDCSEILNVPTPFVEGFCEEGTVDWNSRQSVFCAGSFSALCNKATAFYGDRYKKTSFLSITSDYPLVAEGCNQLYGFPNIDFYNNGSTEWPGYSNSADQCYRSAEYSIVGNWYGGGDGAFGSQLPAAGQHKIYGFNGSPLTMSISGVYNL